MEQHTTRLAGYDHYDTGRHGDRVLPEEGDVHAVDHFIRKRSPRPAQPVFYDRWSYKAAWCGSVIKVVTPLSFKQDEDGICEACVAAISSGTKRTARWRQRRDAEIDFMSTPRLDDRTSEEVDEDLSAAEAATLVRLEAREEAAKVERRERQARYRVAQQRRDAERRGGSSI